MLIEPNCSKRGCKHFYGFRKPDEMDEPIGQIIPGEDWIEDRNVVMFCKAFPDGKGIPQSILYGKNLYLKPVKGDHGILFEPKTEASDGNK